MALIWLYQDISPTNIYSSSLGQKKTAKHERHLRKICLTKEAHLTHWGRDKMAAISADDTFKPIFLNGNIRISIEISPKFVPKVPINNIPALVQIMAWRRPGDKPLSEPMMVCLLTHICVRRPQWVKEIYETNIGHFGQAWMCPWSWKCYYQIKFGYIARKNYHQVNPYHLARQAVWVST